MIEFSFNYQIWLDYFAPHMTQFNIITAWIVISYILGIFLAREIYSDCSTPDGDIIDEIWVALTALVFAPIVVPFFIIILVGILICCILSFPIVVLNKPKDGKVK